MWDGTIQSYLISRIILDKLTFIESRGQEGAKRLSKPYHESHDILRLSKNSNRYYPGNIFPHDV